MSSASPSLAAELFPTRDPRCVVGLLAARVAEAPGSLALVDSSGATLTYGELGRRVRTVAQALRSRGVGPEVRVGVWAERSSETLVALLGVLAAGGAYVALDPAYPPERLAWMVEDANLALLITPGGAALPPALPAVRTVSLAALILDDRGERSLGEPLAPSQSAYLIYTSGSTGRPKAVVVEHGALRSFVAAALSAYQLTPADRLLQFNSLSWDTSIEEIFPCLAAGATLVLRAAVELEPPALLKLIAAHQVTVVNLPTAYWAALGRVLWEGRAAVPPCVRVVIIGGEPARKDQLALWHSGPAGTSRLFNTYGLTEATAVSTFCELRPGTYEAGVPIGVPFGRARLHLFDAHLRPAAPGEAGELFIGGPGLARCYLGRPDETARRFVPDPFAAEPGARLYRTGDLARVLPDGTVVHLGRADDQVKVRGHRVELGEVEHHLELHPQVAEAAVVGRQEETGITRLVAYVAKRAEATAPSPGELKRFLAERLPTHLVPSAYVVLERLPRLPNNKVARSALPAPATDRPDRTSAPNDATEALLATLWADVLGVDQVGVDDDFFELGGDSILFLRVSARARAKGLSLQLSWIYEAPTVAQLAKLAAATAPSTGGAAPAPGPGAAVAAERRSALLPTQEGILFHSLESKDAGTYLIQTRWRLLPGVSAERLREAHQVLIARHDALRTSVALGEGAAPLLRIAPSAQLDWSVLDLRSAPAAQARARHEALLEEEWARGVDLARAPLLRSALMLGADGAELCWTLHHVALDLWSVLGLLSELDAIYGELSEGLKPSTDPAPSFVDYVAWARAERDRTRAAAEAHFRELLAGLDGPTPFGVERRRVEGDAPRFGAARRMLTEEQTQRLLSWQRQQKITLHTLVAGGWALVLAQLSGSDDVVFGTVLSGRSAPLPAMADRRGLFVNTLPLRVRRGRGQARGQWLKALQAQVGQLVAFETMQLSEVSSWSGVPAGAPIFESILACENVPWQGGGKGALGLSWVGSREQTHYPLTLGVVEGPRIELTALFDATRFDPEAIERLLEQWWLAMEALGEHPADDVRGPPLLTPGERERLLGEWNATSRPFSTLPAPAQIAAVARERPDALAVSGPGRQLTYAGLEAEANRLAWHLRSLGVGPEVPVGICLQQSVEAVVALLGVLKASGAYVPLPPDYPAERLAFMAADAGVRTVVTVHRHASAPLPPGLQRVWLDEPGPGADSGRQAPPLALAPGTLAYSIYTSGSTGRPKGVLVSHAALANLVASARELYGLSRSDRVLQLSALSWDVSVLEIFATLAAGATVVVGDRDTLEIGAPLLGLMRDQAVTFAFITPALLANLPMEPLPALRTLLVGGDACPLEVLERWAVGRRLFCAYGPTEACVLTCNESFAAGTLRTPLGRPYPNMRAYVLDAQLCPVPIGVTGDFYVGGVQLARGYRGRADLTADRFVPDPFSPVPGARMYKTGDLARYGSDGQLEFRGRRDNQVKVRGFRIELGEVEEALARHPDVKEAAVLADTGPSGKRLVAYAVGKAGRTLVAAHVQQFLQTILPEFMVPASIVGLDRFPLTPSGKVDRLALARSAPQPAQVSSAGADASAWSDLERTLHAMWREVLGTEDFGVNDRFFDLGGDSISALRLVSLAAQAGLKLKVRAIVSEQTIANLARLLGGQPRGQPPAAPPPAQVPGPSAAGESPLAPIQRWFFEQELAAPNHFNQAQLYAVEKALKVDLLDRAVSHVAARHDVFSLRFFREGGQWHQTLGERPHPIPVERLSLVDVAPAQRAGAIETACRRLHGSLDIATGPLSRLCLFDLGPGAPARLFWVAHHLIIDAVSWGILLEELMAVYDALERGQAPPPLGDATPYTAWTRALARVADSPGARRESEAWRRVVQEGSAPLPARSPAARNTVESMREVVVRLSAEETDRLFREALPRRQAQIQPALLAALACALAELTSKSVLVDLEGHGRSPLGAGLDLTRSVGWFTALYPVRVTPSEGNDPAPVLAAAKQALEAIADGGIGFGLRPGESMRSGAEVVLNYFGREDGGAGRWRLSRAPESSGNDRAAGQRRAHLLEVEGAVVGGCLAFAFRFSEHLHERAQIEAMGDRFIRFLRAL